MTQEQNTCIILFAKFPAKGMAKTRLQPALGSDGAAKMAKQLLLHSVEQALATGFSVELCVSPPPNTPCWQTLNLPESLTWSAQADGDLGERMYTASTQALAKFKKVLLIGSDCPSLTAAVIQDAAQQLDNLNSVMIPAFDGGYVLLGFRQINAHLFTNMTWSVSDVAAVTKQRIKDLNWSLASLQPLPDIDEPEDLQYLPTGWLDGYELKDY